MDYVTLLMFSLNMRNACQKPFVWHTESKPDLTCRLLLSFAARYNSVVVVVVVDIIVIVVVVIIVIVVVQYL